MDRRSSSGPKDSKNGNSKKNDLMVLDVFEEYCGMDNLRGGNGGYMEDSTEFEWKDIQLPMDFFNSLHFSLNKLDTLTTLKLQNCRMRADQLSKLSEILSEHNSIIDVNLDMNPNALKNHYLLCKRACNLQHLSLSFCNLEDSGISKISEELEYKDEENHTSLITLNLSHNRITDMGAKSLGKMLHTNRSIRSLDLTANWIHDDGASSILDELYIFSLTHNEIVQLRKRKLSRLLQREKLEVQSTLTHMSGNEQRSESIHNGNKSDHFVREGFTNPESRINDLGDDLHPFSTESYPLNGEIMTVGNLVLQDLNFNYNKLSNKILDKLIKVIHHHHYMGLHDLSIGLLHVNLEGNKILRNQLFAQFVSLMEDRRNDKIEPEDIELFVPIEIKILKSRMNL